MDIKMNIALIDDHQLLLHSLANILSTHDFIKSIKTYRSAKEYIQEVHDPEPDIIISDILMPGMSGIELLSQFKQRNNKVKVILLSSIIEAQTIRYAIRNGASGYLSKDASPDEVADALLAVYNGDIYIGESLRKVIIRNTLVEDQFIYHLSPREKEVLNRVCSGLTIKEIAFEMKLSANTVQTYYKSILKKFKLNRTADLIVFAIQNGLYNPNQNL